MNDMKRILLIGMVLVLVGALAACAPKDAPAGPGSGKEATDSPLSTDYENALPVLSQLMVGTFKLEDGGPAVTAAQAAELTILWKAYRGMSTSDSVAALELDALLEQIQDTMTAEQLKAIAGMQLTRQDLAAVMQAQGVEMGARGGRGNLSPEQIQAMQTRRAQAGGGGAGGFGGGPGGGPGGPPGGFGGAPGGGQAPNPEQIATLQAQRGGGGALMIQGPLFDALIKLLESKG